MDGAGATGTLCRFQETANFLPAVSWSGVLQISHKVDILKVSIMK
jgi:hypothetical protein